MHIYLARHGQVCPPGHALADPEHPPGDPPLTALGREQATLLARRLREAGFQGKVYASPYRRTVETAHIVAACVDAPVVLSRPIREIVKRAEAMRAFEGCTLDQLRADFPRVEAGEDFFYPWWEHEPETDEAVTARVAPFVDALIEQGGGDALLVGHGASVHAGTVHLLRRFEPERLRNMEPTWNCALTAFRIAPAFAVRSLACVEHLPEEAVTANFESRDQVLERRRQRAAEQAAEQTGEQAGQV